MKRDFQPDCAEVRANAPPLSAETRTAVTFDDEDLLILIEFFKTLDRWDRDAENLRKIV
jgi:hypothetical protein